MKSINPRNQVRRAKNKGITLSELIILEQEEQLKREQGYKRIY